MNKIDLKELSLSPFCAFDKNWALVSAGPLNDHNAMTISWGELGTLWGKSVATVYVKPARHTYSFMEKNDLFSVSFFPEGNREALSVMGTFSGREGNKDQKAGLHPMEIDGVTTYEEANLVLVCRKIYFADLLKENMSEETFAKYYEKQAPHRMYVGEVLAVYRK